MVDLACRLPALNSAVFPSAGNGAYWSASPYAGAGDMAWSIDAGYGDVELRTKGSAYRVRLVRGGE